jgi:protein involved in polysaccharide export with SLBB domain
MKYIETRRNFVFFMVSAIICIGSIQAQEEQSQVPNTQVQLAISSPSYPVTSGDVYSLTYVAGGVGPVSYLITVDSSYRIRVSNLGIINVAGKTYRQLKQDAETIVSNNYPLSGVQLTMIKPSVFSVYIKGEVTRTAELTTWAMGRLSSLVNGSLSAYSSTRNITVTSADGTAGTYDLFKAQRFGDLSQDPYLRPGDIITISHLDRKVSIYGHVERPGSYELLTGENIRDLIFTYANGYTSRADTDRVEITRFVENNEAVGDTIYLTQAQINANYVLQHADAVYIPPKMP